MKKAYTLLIICFGIFLWFEAGVGHAVSGNIESFLFMIVSWPLAIYFFFYGIFLLLKKQTIITNHLPLLTPKVYYYSFPVFIAISLILSLLHHL